MSHALETNKTVTGEDIEAIIEGRRGALLDGRPYHDPRFLGGRRSVPRAGGQGTPPPRGRLRAPAELRPVEQEVAAFVLQAHTATRPRERGGGSGDEDES